MNYMIGVAIGFGLVFATVYFALRTRRPGAISSDEEDWKRADDLQWSWKNQTSDVADSFNNGDDA